MVYSLLGSKWIQEETLQPMADPQSVEVTILDTATDEKNADLERIQSIRESIQETKEELRDPEQGRLGNINISYKLITDRIQLNDRLDLLEEDTVEHIATGNGMDPENWWLRDEHINENLNFATGVIRKRGLGKGLYYKAYAEDDEISAAIDLPIKGEVAILAGLGGGTGSGILFDLAERIHQDQPMSEITLFGVLPNPQEGIDEATNAFAVLSELEYLSLNNEELFEDRILIPIDPTGFRGKIGDQMGSRDILDELDEAIVYLISAYYNQQGMEDPFEASPTYAPFTIGIPQVIRYRVKDIQDSKERLRELLNVKDQELEAAQKIYEDIEQRFLDRHYGISEDFDGSLRDDARADLESRFNSIQELTEFEIFQDLDYVSTELFQNILHDARQEAEEIEDQIDIAARQVNRQQLEPDQEFRDDIDERLAEVLERNISVLNRRARILQQRKTIETSRVRRTVEYLLGLNKESVNTGVWDSNLENDLTEAKEQLEETREELAESEEKLEEVRSEQAEQIRRQIDEWRGAVESDIQQYKEIESVPVERLIADLETALNEYARQIEAAESEAEVEDVSAQEINVALEDLVEELDNVGVNTTQLQQQITNALNQLRSLRTDSIICTQEAGLIEEWMPWETSTEEERKEARRSYQLEKRELEDDGIFEAGPASNFNIEVTFSGSDIENNLENRRQELQRQIVDSLRSRLEDPDRDLIDRFEREIEDDVDLENLVSIARDAFRSELDGTDDLEQRHEQLEKDIEKMEDQVEILDATYELFGRRVSDREIQESKQEEFQDLMSAYIEETQSRTTTTLEDDSFSYIKEVTPNNVLRMTNIDHIGESNLFDSAAERQELQEYLEELVANARDQQYAGLNERTLNDGQARYDQMRVGVAVLSRAIRDINIEILDFRDQFTESFDLQTGSRTDRYISWPQREIGDDWDIGFAVFIDGVFLDNLRNVTDSDGFQERYRRKEQSDEDIVVHHSYGLEDGQYIRRDTVLNLERQEDIGLYLQNNEQNIIQKLLDEYIEVTDIADSESVSVTEDGQK